LNFSKLRGEKMTRRIVTLAMLSANYVFCASCSGGADTDYSARPPLFNKLYVPSSGVGFGRGGGSHKGEAIKVTGFDPEPFGRGVARANNPVHSIVIGSGITSIPKHAFRDMPKLQNVSFEPSSKLTDIGEDAFGCCHELRSINIPRSVQTIGKRAFSWCKALSSVMFESSSNLQEIGPEAFYNTGLEFITIPARVTTINEAFSFCTNLKVVTFEPESSLTAIGPSTFAHCRSLQEIEIPSNIPRIGESAFSCCGLTSITIPSTVLAIDASAFAGSEALQVVTFATGSVIAAIAGSTFRACRSLISITLPPSVVSIGAEAFVDCTGLSSVIFATGSQLNTIGRAAFGDCTNVNGGLLEINCPDSVTKIEPGAFAGTRVRLSIPESCIPQLPQNPAATPDEQRLVEIQALGSIFMRVHKSGNYYNNKLYKFCELDENSVGSIVRIVKADGTDTEYTLTNAKDRTWRCKDKERQYNIPSPTVSPTNGAVDFGDGGYRLPEGEISTVNFLHPALSTIPPYALPIAFGGSHCSKINHVGIGPHIAIIGPQAFHGIPLHSVNFAPESQLITIGDKAFYGCPLHEINIPSTVRTLGKEAFAHTPLANISWSDSIESVGAYAFFHCQWLQSINIPSCVSSIEVSTFQDCTRLTAVAFPNNSQLRTIKERAFCTCPLETITIPAGVIEIGPDAFSWTALTSVTFQGNNLKTIGKRAFDGCKQLREIQIPTGVKTIGAKAFSGCCALTNINVPAGIERIEDHALADCSALTSITFPAGIEHIGDHALVDCRALRRIEFDATSDALFNGAPASTETRLALLNRIAPPYPDLLEARFADSPNDVFEVRGEQWQHRLKTIEEIEREAREREQAHEGVA
jgi:hypothetical protein